jgi:LmbE family N-acetylglucosaminyl deacetylase
MQKTKTIMAVGGHIGDMELTTGGVLATLAAAGHKIVTVALTGGEKGNPPDQTVAEYRAQKVREAAEFAALLGGESVVLDIPDGTLEVTEAVKFAVCDLIRRHRPDALLTHWPRSIHKDHEATSLIVRDAQFYAALPGFERALPAHFAAGPYYAENWEDPEGFRPHTYIAVSQEGFALWEKAISRHWFAVHSPSFEYMKYYAALMTVRGIEARCGRAQAFALEETARKAVKSEF